MLKVIIIVAIVGGGYFYLTSHNSKLLHPQALTTQLKDAATHVSINAVAQNLGATLDSLITHADKNSPVVLGVKISNDSLGTIVDFLQKLPPDQISQIKSAICSPASPSSAR